MSSVAEVGFSHFEGLSPDQQEQLSELLDDYFAHLEQGRPVDREQLIARYPDLAGPLAVYLDSIEFLQNAAVGFATVGEPIELGEADDCGPRQLGDFRIVREIGRGGMGIVYEAWQISLDRRVALKVLPFAALLDAKQIARFRNEAQAAAQLHHLHIVPVFFVGVERGVHYYAMQFIDGQSLDRAIEERRLGDRDTEHEKDATGYFRTVARLGVQAAEALHCAHEFGIVHRDVKPSNLLLDAEGKLWVTDFGLARFHSNAQLTGSGEFVGTIRYMSPEQARGESHLVDHRTDVYSLGVTLYELLTLKHPVPATPVDVSRLGGIHNNLGMVLERQERWHDAVANYAQAIEYQSRAADLAPQVVRFRELLSNHRENHSRAERRLGHG